MKKFWKNERGDMPFLTLFLMLAVVMVMSFVLLFATVKINCINIRNAFKMELNNVSASIYADIFHSQREANLMSYMADVHISPEYLAALEEGFIDGVKEKVPLVTDDYTLSEIEIQFFKHSDKIEYIATGLVTFNINMFGRWFPPIEQEIRLTGTHNTKY